MSEAATGGVVRKKVFFKMSQSSQETPVPEETSVNFAKFLRTSFLQNNSGRLLVKCGHFNNESWMQCSVASVREPSNHLAFMSICPANSHTY